MKKQIFTYWEGDHCQYIKHCITTIQKNSGVKVIILNDSNVDRYINCLLSHNYKKLTNIPQKVDCIRCAVLHENGGMWCDADTIFIKNCSHLFVDEYDYIGIRWTHNNNFCNGYFFAKKHSAFLRDCIDFINKELTYNFNYYYEHSSGCYFGEYLFSLFDYNKYEVKDIPLETFIPVNFPFRQKIWDEPYEIKNFLCDCTVAIGLNNSSFDDRFKTLLPEEIASCDNMIGSAFRYSGVKPKKFIEYSKKVSPRSLKEARLPEDFSPMHPKWKVPSMRGRYINLLGGTNSIRDFLHDEENTNESEEVIFGE